eukprot:2289902-Rhodomonas_salina.5
MSSSSDGQVLVSTCCENGRYSTSLRSPVSVCPPQARTNLLLRRGHVATLIFHSTLLLQSPIVAKGMQFRVSVKTCRTYTTNKIGLCQTPTLAAGPVCGADGPSSPSPSGGFDLSAVTNSARDLRPSSSLLWLPVVSSVASSNTVQSSESIFVSSSSEAKSSSARIGFRAGACFVVLVCAGRWIGLRRVGDRWTSCSWAKRGSLFCALWLRCVATSCSSSKRAESASSFSAAIALRPA